MLVTEFLSAMSDGRLAGVVAAATAQETAIAQERQRGEGLFVFAGF